MKSKLMMILSLCIILCLLSGCENQNKEVNSREGLISRQMVETSSSAQSEENKEMEVEILKDSEMKLHAEKAREKNIMELMRMISREGSRSLGSPAASLDDVREFVSIPQLRPISIAGSRGGLEFYSVHDSLSGGRLFVFYSKENEDGFLAYNTIFIGKTLHFNNFDPLIEGNSTLEDVEEIDPAAKFNFFNPEDPEPNHYVSFLDQGGLNDDYYYYSVHATKDGVVNIGYKKSGDDFIVHEIYKSENLVIDGEIYDPVAAINENDWP